jgi:membrane protease YdiL (CAAX protease family)
VIDRIPFGDHSVLSTIVNMVVFFVAILVPVTIMENTLGLHPKLFKKVDIKNSGAAVLYGYLLILGASFANSLLLLALKSAGLEFAPRTINVPQGTFAAVLYFIYVCILPPLLEEIFTRGYILNAFRGYGTTFAVVLSSVCFALLHSSLENFPVYFCCGVVLALVYITFDSIFPAMMLHCLNNTVSFFMSTFQNRVNAVSALSLIVFVYICIIAFGYSGKKYLDSKGIKLSRVMQKEQEMFKKFKTVFAAPMGLVAFYLLLFLAAYSSYNNLV